MAQLRGDFNDGARDLGMRHSVPDSVDEAALAQLLRRALAPIAAKAGGDGITLLWDDGDSQALVHLHRLAVTMVKRLLIVSVEFETEQTGIAPLIVTFGLGSTQDKAGLIAVTDEQPRGHPLLVARWGAAWRDALWSALIATARRHANERKRVPGALHVLDGHIRFIASEPIDLVGEAVRLVRSAKERAS